MRVELIIGSCDHGTYVTHELKVDDKYYASVGPLCECPEDAIIGRDLLDGHDIIRAIKLGWEASQAGQQIVITERAKTANED